MKAIAAWRIERGTEIATLEQLLGSRAIGSTIITQIKLRSFNLSALLLVLLWMLSPFGGQASLRTSTLLSSPYFLSIPVAYVDYDSDYHMYTLGSWWSSTIEAVKAIYSTALIGSDNVKQSPQDAWGNLKIPMLELLDNYDPLDISKWLSVNRTINLTYSSLIGLPIAPLKTGTNLTFSLDTFYMLLRCDALSFRGGSKTMTVPPGMIMVANAQHFQIATPNDRIYGGPTWKEKSMVPRPLVFEAQKQGNANDSNLIVHTKCDLMTSFVELSVFCLDKLCATTSWSKIANAFCSLLIHYIY